MKSPSGRETGQRQKEQPQALCAPAIKPVLRRGDRSEEVREMQYLLARKDYMRESECDGRFGYHTLASLSLFQSNHGLAETGVCDERTWEALERK